jgi:hypothetical protein
MTDAVFETWFSTLAFLECRHGALMLLVGSEFLRTQVQ